VELALDSHVPLQKLLCKVDAGKTLQKRGYDELQQASVIDTVYGKLIGLLPIPGADGRTLQAEYIDPCALLCWAASASLPFFRLVQWCVTTSPQKRMRFCLYHDGVTPGNNHRPDVGRSFLSFLWTFLEMPMWLRNRGRLRWFTMSYILKRTMKNYGMHVRDITKAILFKLFRRGDFNLSHTGLLLEHGNEQLMVVFTPSCVTQDFEAHQVMFDLKGAAGLNPCPYCDNSIGRREFFQDESGFEHILSARYDKFKIRDVHRINDIVAELKELASQGLTTELDRTEKATGYVFHEEGVLFSDVADVFQLPDAIYMDCTHCICASGGIGQFTINQFVLALIMYTAITLLDLDQFSAKIKTPRGHSRISKHWFEERIVNQPNAHCRGFASETLAVVDVLAMFVEVVLKPMNVLHDEIDCLLHLWTLLGCIRRGQPEDAAKAIVAAQKHHDAFMKLHPQCGKPKLHYTWHASRSWMKFEVLIQCFGAESEHKQPKRLMNHCYNKCHLTAMKYWVRSFHQYLLDPQTWTPTFLAGTLRECDIVLPVVGLGSVTFIMSSLELVTRTGTYHKSDFVYWQGGMRGGIALSFVMAKLQSGELVFVAIVSGYTLQVASGFWVAAQHELVNAEKLEGATAFLQEGDAWLRPLMPAQ